MNIQKKFSLSILAIIAVMVVAGALFTYQGQKTELMELAETQALSAEENVIRLLSVTDDIIMERVRSSMTILQESGKALGQARLGETVVVGEHRVPQLYLGDEPMANRYELVDSVTRKMGGTATLFVRSGSDFVRVSTNVMKNGQRATGTTLSRDSAAYGTINRDQAFFGQVDILGSPYLTGYAPIRNAQGEVIGIWYVGYSADLSTLQSSIEAAQVLDEGFVGLLDGKGQLRMHTRNDKVSDAIVEEALASEDGSWDIERVEFEPWGYQVVTGISQEEVSGMILNRSLSMAGVIVAAGILIILAVIALLRVIVARPMAKMVEAITDIAEGKGDLTVRLNSDSNDEFGAMANGFDKVLAKIQATMKEVGVLTEELTTSASNLAHSSAKALTAVDQQRQDTEHVATSMHEMSVTAQTVAQSASLAEESARGGDMQAKEGRHTLESTIAKIEDQSENIEACMTSVRELEEHSGSIASVLEIIHGIAEQTNLLALNAAIEAARAGEHGRGFSVVSDEVRNLARRTQAAIDDIREKIDVLQSGTAEMASKMTNTQDLSLAIRDSARECGEAMAKISGAISTITAQNADIASAAEEQSQVSEEINKTLDSINNMARENAEGATANSKSSEALEALAAKLTHEMSKYKV